MRVRVAQFLVVTTLTFFVATAWAADAVVLVTGVDSPIDNISSLDIRKVYFGISVTVDGTAIHAIRRRDDERLNQIFLQSVIAMSHRSYERRLLSLVLKFGTPRPVEVENYGDLSELLARNRSFVAYVWKSEADSDPSVKIIGVLWQ